MIDTAVLAFSWEEHDHHRNLTVAALFGIPLAGLLARFGLPPVDLHGPLHYLGIMGPTCGLTRSVMWFTRGQIATAWEYNPVGLLLVPAAFFVLGRAGFGWWTGRWLQITIHRSRWLVAFIVIGALALTIRQQLRVDLLS